MPKYRVTIKSTTWLGDHSAPNKQRTVISRNKKLAVHAAYQSVIRSKDCMCYSHHWKDAKIERITSHARSN